MTRSRTKRSPVPRHQRGAVLVVALIFLVLLTILALTASSSSMMQLRMAGNLRAAAQAEFAANTALRGAEWRLWMNAVRHVPFLCTDGYVSLDGCVVYNPKADVMYERDVGEVVVFQDPGGPVGTVGVEFLGAGGGGFDQSSSLDETARLAENPRYLVEDLGPVRPPGAGPQQEYNAGAGAGGITIHSYRITARAAGTRASNLSVMQSVLDAQPNN